MNLVLYSACGVEPPQEGVENMTYIDRHKTPRKWSIQTQHTRSIGARLPNDLYERLKTFCAQHGETTTGVVCSALEQYMDSYEDDGKEDGGYFLY